MNEIRLLLPRCRRVSNSVCFPGLPGDYWHWRQWRCIPAHHTHTRTHTAVCVLFFFVFFWCIYRPNPSSSTSPVPVVVSCIIDSHRYSICTDRLTQPPAARLLPLNNKSLDRCCICGWSEWFQTSQSSAATHQIKLGHGGFPRALICAMQGTGWGARSIRRAAMFYSFVSSASLAQAWLLRISERVLLNVVLRATERQLAVLVCSVLSWVITLCVSARMVCVPIHLSFRD